VVERDRDGEMPQANNGTTDLSTRIVFKGEDSKDRVGLRTVKGVGIYNTVSYDGWAPSVTCQGVLSGGREPRI
jgi:hypothetical protein